MSGLDVAAVAILLLLSNKEAKAHAVKKFSWLRIFQNNTTEEIVIELAAVVEESRGDREAVDEMGSEAAGVETLEVEETSVGEESE